MSARPRRTRADCSPAISQELPERAEGRTRSLTARGRLIFALDATAGSRKPTWDMAAGCARNQMF